MLNNKKFWLFPFLLVLPAVVIYLGGATWASALRYEAVLLTTEPWRILTGHWAHLGIEHLLLNVVGLILVWELLGRYWAVYQWAVATIAIALLSSASFYFFQTQLQWYVGLSGVEHGMLAFGLVAAMQKAPKFWWLLAVGLVLKLIWEYFFPQPFAADFIGGNVVTAAHRWGCVWGVLIGVLWASYQQFENIKNNNKDIT